MTDLQSKLFAMLEEIDAICKKHDITYYLAAGGSLGAVRNGGFLPWDDDLDLYITSDNWEKFKAVIMDELPENRAFVCEEMTEDYLNPIGRYVDKESTMMMRSQMMIGECCGEFVEFFIFDLLPADPDAAWEQRKNMKLYTELLSPYFILNKQLLEGNSDFDYPLFLEYYERCKKEGFDKVTDELKAKITNCSWEDAGYYCMRWGTITYIFPKESFGEPRYIEFEGKPFPVVNQVERVLRLSYGDDWMCVPTVSNQVVHGLNQDIYTPYEKFTSIYLPLLDKPALRKAHRDIKDLRIQIVQERTDYQREFALAKMELVERRIKDFHYDIPKMQEYLRENKIAELYEELKYFIQFQGEKDIKDHSLLADVCDEYLELVIGYHLAMGNYNAGSKILKLRKKKDAPLSEGLVEYENRLFAAHEISVAIYDDRDYDQVKEALKKHADYSDKLVDYNYGKLWCMKHDAVSKRDFINLAEEVNRMAGIMTLTGELKSMKAYALYRLGELDESKALYIEACNQTRNAFIWKEANECFSEIDMYADMK
ncbi:MAG: LicD family protein [Eubacterium sp.]|nr:LicD family protein [Candidatus Colimonas fimequi]